jgi:hypothetical protein
VSQILLHETSPEAIERIFAESHRLLRPGGLVVHLEVPIRYDQYDVFDQFFRSWEQYYNNEPNIEGAASADLRGLAARRGFRNILAGYQKTPPNGTMDAAPLSDAPPPGYGSWYIVSGLKADVQ